jgi:hypothetical protein
MPTFERYQPLSPVVPVRVYETCGPAAAAVETTTPERITSASASGTRVAIRRSNGDGLLRMALSSPRFPGCKD